MGRKSNLGDGQKAEAVLALLRREEPAAVLARRYGVAEGTLYSWRDKFLAGGKAALASGQGAGDPRARRVQELERALEERDRVVGELTIANRVLKKTADGLY
jgi:transposase